MHILIVLIAKRKILIFVLRIKSSRITKEFLYIKKVSYSCMMRLQKESNHNIVAHIVMLTLSYNKDTFHATTIFPNVNIRLHNLKMQINNPPNRK